MEVLATAGGKRRTVLRAVSAIGILLLAQGLAAAQPPADRPEVGFMFGFSFGLGKLMRGETVPPDATGTLALLHDDGRDLVEIAVDLQFGFMFKRRLGIMGIVSTDNGYDSLSPAVPVAIDVQGQTAAILAENIDTGSVVIGGGVQYWLTPRVWVRGGIGVGDLSRDFAQSKPSETFAVARTSGVAWLTAAGLEVYRSGPAAADMQFRYSTYSAGGLRVHNAAVMFGVNIYWTPKG